MPCLCSGACTACITQTSILMSLPVRVFILCCCTLLVAVCLTPVASATREENLEREITLQAADESFDAGDYPVALALYDQLLATDPGNVHALLRSGLIHSWESRYDDALQRYARLLELDPGNRAALRERAIDMGDLSKDADKHILAGRSPVLVVVNDTVQGLLVVADEVKPHAKEAITHLKEMGFDLYLLSGDSKRLTAKPRMHFNMPKT